MLGGSITMLLTQRIQLFKRLCLTHKKYCVRDLSFLDRSLDPSLVRRLRSFEIMSPTYIQHQAFEAIVNGENIVLNSETGSGKTLAYALPIFHNIYRRKREKTAKLQPAAIILTPSVELCYQVGDVFRTVLGAQVSLVTSELRMRLKDTDVVVSTPQAISSYPYDVLKETETIVIDEADIQIDRRVGKHGHKDPLFKFMNHMLVGGDDNKKRNFVFVGATMPDSDHRKSRKAMPYIRAWIPDVRVVKGNEAHRILSKLDMTYVNVEKGNKLKHFVQTVEQLTKESVGGSLKVLVFVDQLKKAQRLSHELTHTELSNRVVNQNTTKQGADRTFPEQMLDFQRLWSSDVFSIHRDVPRDERLTTLHHFNSAQNCILITTDVSSRGLDFQEVDVVLQYDFAKNVADFVHRVGRTGRMGRPGKVVNFVSTDDERLASLIQQYSETGDSLDKLFSRRRGLSRALRSRDNNVAM